MQGIARHPRPLSSRSSLPCRPPVTPLVLESKAALAQASMEVRAGGGVLAAPWQEVAGSRIEERAHDALQLCPESVKRRLTPPTLRWPRRWRRQALKLSGHILLTLAAAFCAWETLRNPRSEDSEESLVGSRRLDENVAKDPVFSQRERQEGAVIVWAVGLFYMFVALAIVCDEFFVPALEVITETLQLSPDVAGATFMAAGGSAPEFFTSMIGVVIYGSSDIGIGTIVGSAVFNVLFCIGACALVAPTLLQLTWFPLARDSTFYIVDLITLVSFFSDGVVKWWESCILFFLYLCYVVFMRHSVKIEHATKRCLHRHFKKITTKDTNSAGEQQSTPGQQQQVWASARSPTSGDRSDHSKSPEGDTGTGTHSGSSPDGNAQEDFAMVMQSLGHNQSEAASHAGTGEPCDDIDELKPGDLTPGDSTPGELRHEAPTSELAQATKQARKRQSRTGDLSRGSSTSFGSNVAGAGAFKHTSVRQARHHEVSPNAGVHAPRRARSVSVVSAGEGVLPSAQSSRSNSSQDQHKREGSKGRSSPKNYRKSYSCTGISGTSRRISGGQGPLDMEPTMPGAIEGGSERGDSLRIGKLRHSDTSDSSINRDSTGGSGGQHVIVPINPREGWFSVDGTSPGPGDACVIGATMDPASPRQLAGQVAAPSAPAPELGLCEGGGVGSHASKKKMSVVSVSHSIGEVSLGEVTPLSGFTSARQSASFTSSQLGNGAPQVSMSFNRNQFQGKHSPSSESNSLPEQDVVHEGEEGEEDEDDEENEEEDENEPLDLWPPEPDAGTKEWLWYICTFPIVLVLFCTIPDVRRKCFKGLYIVSFAISIFWIAVFTYFMLYSAHIVAETFGMHEVIIALLVLAPGTSVPDLLTSVIVARQGHGDMAISSSIGSNIFDVTVGLPVPWMLDAMMNNGRSAGLENQNMEIMVGLLLVMLVYTIISVMAHGWAMTKLMGFIMLFMYVCFMVLSVCIFMWM